MKCSNGMLTAVLILAAVDARPAQAQSGFWEYAASGQADVQYVMNADGTYSGKKTTVTGDNTSGTHYTCSPTTYGQACSACGKCHMATQVQSKTYVAKYDWKRHVSLHFPKLVANLQPGQKMPWGTASMISYRDKMVIATSRDRVPKDLVLFPAGSKIVLDPRGQAAFVVMPSTGEPKAVAR
jgi:hypothetical protein